VFCPGFSGNPDSSKSCVFILRCVPTSTVKKHKLKFYEEIEEFLSFFCSGCAYVHKRIPLSIYKEKAREDDPLRLSLMKKQIPVCMSASTIFSGDWWNSLHRSPEG
jgi:hypothetical protein